MAASWNLGMLLLAGVCLTVLTPVTCGVSFEDVADAIDQSDRIASLYLVVGNASGLVFTHQKGDTASTTHPLSLLLFLQRPN